MTYLSMVEAYKPVFLTKKQREELRLKGEDEQRKKDREHFKKVEESRRQVLHSIGGHRRHERERDRRYRDDKDQNYSRSRRHDEGR